jgi:hypothetical protein
MDTANNRIIHVDVATIQRNKQHGRSDPPVTIRHPSGQITQCHEIEIDGPCKIRYAPPTDAGSTGNSVSVWIETRAPLTTHRLGTPTLHYAALL